MMLLRGQQELCHGSSSYLLDHIKQTSAQVSPNIYNYVLQKKISTLPRHVVRYTRSDHCQAYRESEADEKVRSHEASQHSLPPPANAWQVTA